MSFFAALCFRLFTSKTIADDKTQKSNSAPAQISSTFLLSTIRSIVVGVSTSDPADAFDVVMFAEVVNVGSNVGSEVGSKVGTNDGVNVGLNDGFVVGLLEGAIVGPDEGALDGEIVGPDEGDSVGTDVG